ncbi:MAG: PadR family transcriptional regulator [bacterium]
MTTELLILMVLFEEKSTIYGLKQKIEKLFSLFLKISFGTIHPALKKLEENKYVLLKAKTSSGGQKSSLYSITEEGKEYFTDLMIENLPDNPTIANQLVNIKLMGLSRVDPESQKLTLDSILRYLENQKIKAKNLRADFEDIENKIQQKVINYNIQRILEDIQYIQKISEDICWINSLI